MATTLEGESTAEKVWFRRRAGRAGTVDLGVPVEARRAGPLVEVASDRRACSSNFYMKRKTRTMNEQKKNRKGMGGEGKRT